MQVTVRLLFLLANIVGNLYILLTNQNSTSGILYENYVLLVVVFNVAMIAIVYVVDYVIVKVRRDEIDRQIGKHFTQHKEW